MDKLNEADRHEGRDEADELTPEQFLAAFARIQDQGIQVSIAKLVALLADAGPRNLH